MDVAVVKEMASRLYAALDKQDWSTLAELVHPDVMIQLGSTSPISLSTWREGLGAFYVGFPDGHHIIDACLVDGDYAVTRCRFVGTHHGVFHGVAPTGRRVSVGVIHMDRFKDLRLVEHIGQLDMTGLMRQIA